jgi:hypothetical protein
MMLFKFLFVALLTFFEQCTGRDGGPGGLGVEVPLPPMLQMQAKASPATIAALSSPARPAAALRSRTRQGRAWPWPCLAPTAAHRRPSGSATLRQPHRRCALEPRAYARTRRGRAQPWLCRLGDTGSVAGDSERWGLGRSSWRGSRGLLLERTMAGERQP